MVAADLSARWTVRARQKKKNISKGGGKKRGKKKGALALLPPCGHFGWNAEPHLLHQRRIQVADAEPEAGRGKKLSAFLFSDWLAAGLFFTIAA